MKDIHRDSDYVNSLAPASRTATTNGTGVDLQGFEGAEIIITAGTITDGTHAPKLQESDNGSTFADVSSSDLLGTFSNITSNSTQKVGYVGNKRYIRVVVTVSGATTGGVYAAIVRRGLARHEPVD